jgi:GT2 family glycosyltransferase
METKPQSKLEISVIIPHLNQPDGLDACLESLDDQTLERSRFEIIVVDNGSVSFPADVVSNRPGTRLLLEKQPGPGPARNLGIEHATGEVIALIDADCRAHPDWLRNALQTMYAAPARTILGGDVRIWQHNDQATFTAIEAYEAVFAYRFKLYIERHGFSGTGNLVMRRSDFNKVGPFAGIQLAEDMDWGRRANEAGFRFRYVPEMIVYHPARRSLRELYAKWDRQTQHYLNMARGNSAWRIRWTARALAILVSPLVDIATVLRSDRIHGVLARTKAILVLAMVRTHRAAKMFSLLCSGGTLVWNRDDRP